MEEVRSTERPRPQQQHEPDFGITRIQNLNLVADIVLNNVEDDAMSEMTGYISGWKLLMRFCFGGTLYASSFRHDRGNKRHDHHCASDQ